MITYTQPKLEDKVSLKSHYASVIAHTFMVDGIDDPEDLQTEIETKYGYIDCYYRGADTHFIVAKDGKRIIGGVAIYRPNQDVHQLMDGNLDHLYEMGSLYIHPDYQGQGIGSVLIKEMQDYMRAHGATSYCFDAAYTLAIDTWTKRFGTANYIFENYWGEGEPHHIWIVQL